MTSWTIDGRFMLLVLGGFLALAGPVRADEGFNSTNGPLTVGAGGETVMWVTPSDAGAAYGKNAVGVGTETPQAKLDVNGGVRVGSEACTANKAGTLVWSQANKRLYVCTTNGVWARVPPQ